MHNILNRGYYLEAEEQRYIVTVRGSPVLVVSGAQFFINKMY